MDPARGRAGTATQIGRYRIERELGAGSMGRVHLAWDEDARRWVAIKILLGEQSDRLERFEREVSLLAGLTHPGVVRVHDAGRHAGRPYLVMEYVEDARELGEVLPTLDRRERLRLLLEVARAVAYMHERGVVHRDLKPANVLVDGEGRARVCDFGVAWARGVDRLTATGAMVGTPSYMAPEQFEGARSGRGPFPQTDVWALGVLLYEALTDQLPFRSAVLAELMSQVVLDAPRAPRAVDGSVPAELERVCLKAICKAVEDRHADAGELAAELAAAVDAAASRPRRRVPRAALAGGAALVVTVIGGLSAVLVNRSSVVEAPAPKPAPVASDVAIMPAPVDSAQPVTPKATVEPPSPLRDLAASYTWLATHRRDRVPELRAQIAHAIRTDPVWSIDAKDPAQSVVFRGLRSLVVVNERRLARWQLGKTVVRTPMLTGKVDELVALPKGEVAITRPHAKSGRSQILRLALGQPPNRGVRWQKPKSLPADHMVRSARSDLLAYALAGDKRGRLQVRSATDGKLIGRVRRKPKHGKALGLAFTAEGRRLVVLDGAGRRLSIWRIQALLDGSRPHIGMVQRRRKLEPGARQLVPSGNCRRLALDRGDHVLVLDGRTLKEVARFEAGETAQLAEPTLALDPRGRRLAWRVGEEVMVWDVETQALVRDPIRPSGLAQHLALSPDGLLLAVALASGGVEVWALQLPE